MSRGIPVLHWATMLWSAVSATLIKYIYLKFIPHSAPLFGIIWFSSCRLQGDLLQKWSIWCFCTSMASLWTQWLQISHHGSFWQKSIKVFVSLDEEERTRWVLSVQVMFDKHQNNTIKQTNSHHTRILNIVWVRESHERGTTRPSNSSVRDSESIRSERYTRVL